VVIRQALAMGPKDRNYYESQLRKFEEAAMKELGTEGLGD
jgi:hypothetical protein